MKERFKFNLSDWTKVPIESARLLYEESNDYVSYTVTLADKITQRAYTLSVIIIGALGALIGTILSFEINTTYDKIIFGLIILSVLALFIIGVYLIKIVFPFKLHQLGRQPREINNDKYLAPGHLTKEQAYLAFVVNEIQNNQTKIDFNIKENFKRLQRLKCLMVLILISFFLFVLFYLLIFTLHH